MAHAFYTFEKIKSQQNGWSFRGFAAVPDSMNPDRRWSGDDEDMVHTVGSGFDLVVIEDRFSIGADYLFVRSRGKTDMTLGSAIASSDPDEPDLSFPKTKSTLHTVNVHGDYKLTESLSTRLGYTYARLKSDDWAFERSLIQGMFVGYVALLFTGIFGHSMMRETWYLYAALGLATLRIYVNHRPDLNQAARRELLR